MASALLTTTLATAPVLAPVSNLGGAETTTINTTLALANTNENQALTEPLSGGAPLSSSEAGCTSKTCIKRLIVKYARHFGIDEDLALQLAFCESSFRANIYGDSGRAFGTYQFHRPTFEDFSKQMGEKLDYYNNEDNIKLAMWALANGKQDQWSCYQKVALD